MKAAFLYAATGFSAIASAAIATIDPCPSCPATASPSPITVTAQYQPVSTCTPSQTCSTTTLEISSSSVATLTCKVEPDCTTYSFVSTVIPFLAGSSSTTVTELDAIVTLDHTSTVLTSLIPITTAAPSLAARQLQNTTFLNTTLTRYETLIIDTWCPYNEMGPLAIPGYEGSGLCKACTADPNVLSQVVTVRDCVNNATCSTTIKTWISKLPIATSTSQVSISTQTALPSGGQYVIPVVTVINPADSHYNPVTKSFAVSTGVYQATVIQITKIIDITFIGHPAPTATTTYSELPLSTSTYCPTNGIQTVPMYTTIYPTLPGYGSPIIIDIDVTITVINAPTFIFPVTTIIVTLTSTPETVTVISGTTVTAPVTTTVTTTGGDILPTVVEPSSTFTSGTDSFTTDEPTSIISSTDFPPEITSTIDPDGPTSTVTEITSTTGITVEPTAQSIPGFDFLGCYGSGTGLEEFNLQFVDDNMTPELCANGCLDAGFPFSGTYQTECYCAAAINPADQVSPDACGLSCPGDVTLSCGSGDPILKLLRARFVNPSKRLDVYQFIGTTTTSTTSPATTTESTTSAATETTTEGEPTDTTTTAEPDTTTTSPTITPVETTTTDIPSETTDVPPGPTTDLPDTTIVPSPTTIIGSDTTFVTTPGPTGTLGPKPITAFNEIGCVGSSSGFDTFNFQLTSPVMSPVLCANSCRRDGLAYSGLFSEDCYCAATLGDDSSEVSSGACNIPCPGDPTRTCGGTTSAKLGRRAVPAGILLDVYEDPDLAPPPVETTSSEVPVTTTTGPVSDGPEPTLAPRALNADMELSGSKHHARQLRRGGMLRGEKKSNANLRVKRDFGMRNPFGL